MRKLLLISCVFVSGCASYLETLPPEQLAYVSQYDLCDDTNIYGVGPNVGAEIRRRGGLDCRANVADARSRTYTAPVMAQPQPYQRPVKTECTQFGNRITCESEPSGPDLSVFHRVQPF